MDYRIARNANIILGLSAVGIEAYAFHFSTVHRNFEKTFMAINAFYVLEALVFLIWFSNRTKQYWEIGWRTFSSVILMSCGAYLIWSTVDIRDQICQHWPAGVGTCQLFQVKLVAASMSIANGFFYLLARPRSAQPFEHSYLVPDTYDSQMSPHVASASSQNQKRLSSEVFVVPRAHLQPITQRFSVTPILSNYSHDPTLTSDLPDPSIPPPPPFRSRASFQKY